MRKIRGGEGRGGLHGVGTRKRNTMEDVKDIQG
jgi:hypothetical protein